MRDLRAGLCGHRAVVSPPFWLIPVHRVGYVGVSPYQHSWAIQEVFGAFSSLPYFGNYTPQDKLP